jgi:hypothetical protein
MFCSRAFSQQIYPRSPDDQNPESGFWASLASFADNLTCVRQERKTLNRAKEMNAVSTKVLLLFFHPVCPFAPSIFSQVTPRHVLHS